MIGWSQMNEWYDPSGMLLDVSVSLKKEKIQQTSNLNHIAFINGSMNYFIFIYPAIS
jgi:hypothetical protein